MLFDLLQNVGMRVHLAEFMLERHKNELRRVLPQKLRDLAQHRTELSDFERTVVDVHRVLVIHSEVEVP